MQPFFKRQRTVVVGIAMGVLAASVWLVSILLPDYMSALYLHRTIVNGDSEVTDWQRVFPRRDIANDTERISPLPAGTEERTAVTRVLGTDVPDFLQRTDTSSLLIIKNDKLVLEAYADGVTADTVHTSMSVAKSFVSALAGIAVSEGSITSIDDPVDKYLPEFKGQISAEMTLKHLLSMTAGNEFDDEGGLTGDETIAYWAPNLREILAKRFRSAEKPGVRMHYNDFQAQMMGLVLERATGMSVAQYLQEKIWKPAGMEYAASWSLDSKKGDFEQSAIGLNARSRDYGRFGQLYLNNGQANGKQIIPAEWVTASTQQNSGYGYYWWITPQSTGAADFSARGKHGQIIYVSPNTRTVLVRTGTSTGGTNWPGLMERLAKEL